MAMIYIDAAARQNPVYAAGAAVIKDDGKRYEFIFDLGALDNHEAEWATLDHTLDKAIQHGMKSLIIHTDSKVITDSFDRNFVKNRKYRVHFESIQSKLGYFDLFLINHTLRDRNRSADHLAKEALYKFTKE